MAIGSLLFAVPVFLLMLLTLPDTDAQGNPLHIPLYLTALLPVLYFVFGYIGTALGCLVYNLLFPLVGGFEFETTTDDV